MPTGDTPTFIGNVIYQSGEDNPQDTIKPRLMACGADCSKIAFIEADGYLNPEMMEDAIQQTNSKYVVLDPLQAFLTEKQDITRTNNMRPILRDLGGVAARTGAAIVIIGHMNKGEKSKGIYRGLGSIDITAAARSVLLIGKRKNDPDTRFMTQIKNNLSSFGKAVKFTINDNGGVDFHGECDISEEDLLSTKLEKYYEEFVGQHSNWILVDIYADEGLSATSYTKRDNFKRMLEDCKHKKIDLIITKNVSRFSRNVVDCLGIARDLLRAKPPVGIFFQEQNLNTLTNGNEMILTLMSSIAQAESESKREAIWDQIRFRRRSQQTGGDRTAMRERASPI